MVAVNDLGSPEANAHLFKHDSVHGRFPHPVKVNGDTMDAGRGPIKVTAIKNPAELPWKALGVDIAMECTGIFTSKEKASLHLQAGAKRVLVSAPADGADITVVYGVNEDKLAKEHMIVSNASCTTNCLGPVAYVMHKAVGIEQGFMTTIHSYTGDQPTLDTLHKDLYRARAAALNIIPTSTGAAKAIGLVIPELQGKLDGSSIRVPSPNVSLIDFKFTARPQDERRGSQPGDQGCREVQPARRASSPGRKRSWSRPTSTMTPTRRLSRSIRPRSSTAPSFASLPGTTTNGASPTAWPTPRSP